MASFVLDLRAAPSCLPLRKSKTAASSGFKWLLPVDIFWPRNVAQENFFFCFDFETQRRAFLGYLYVLFWTLHVLWTSGVPMLAWCVVLAHMRSLWVGLVAPSQCHPVWTGSALAPGGARPDFTLRSTFTDLFLPMPC